MLHLAGEHATVVNCSISGSRGSGITISGQNATVLGGDVRRNSVGVEFQPGAIGRVSHSNVIGNRVADIAYDENTVFDVINSRASILFDLTQGEFTQIDNEMNYIARELISTTNPRRTTVLLYRLENILEGRENRLKWVGDGAKWWVATSLVEEALGVNVF